MPKLDDVAHFTAHRADTSNMYGQFDGRPAAITPAEAVAYLNADRQHALVVLGAVGVDHTVLTGAKTVIFKGGRDRPDNFYVQHLPGDAYGGHMDATGAVAAVALAMAPAGDA